MTHMTQACLPTRLLQSSLYAEARELNIYGKEEEKKLQAFRQNSQVTCLCGETCQGALCTLACRASTGHPLPLLFTLK